MAETIPAAWERLLIAASWLCAGGHARRKPDVALQIFAPSSLGAPEKGPHGVTQPPGLNSRRCRPASRKYSTSGRYGLASAGNLALRPGWSPTAANCRKTAEATSSAISRPDGIRGQKWCARQESNLLPCGPEFYAPPFNV